MNNQKKSKGKSMLTGFLGRRQFRYGGYATVLTAIVIAVVILLNVAVGMVENNWALSIDVTALNATDFSDDTKKIVSEVEEEVFIYTTFQDSTNSSLRMQVDEVLNKYQAMNGKITFANIDPAKEPARIKQFAGDKSLTEGSLIITNADETRVKVVDRTEYYYNYTSQYTGGTYTFFDIESMTTGALVYVTSEETPRVFYLTGHDELDAASYCTVLTKQLQSQNYDVATLNLTSNADNIELVNGDTVVIINPARDLSDAEYEILRAWLPTGGRLLFTLQYDNLSELPNFEKLLAYYQMSFGDGVIMEDNSASSNWNSDLYTLVPNMNAEHQVTASMAESGAYMMMPYARPINAVAMPESGIQFDTLLTSSDRAVVMNGDEASAPGTQIVAMTMIDQNQDDSTKDIRIALIGNYYTLADTNLLNYSYNMTFTTNLFNWLVNRESTVEISSKLLEASTLAIPDSATAWTLAAIIVVAIPLVVLIGGIFVWIKRRRL